MFKRSLLYLIAIVVVFVLNLIYSNYAFFVILLLLIILPIVSIFYTLMIKDKVTITLSMKEDVSIRGDKNNFMIEINNQSFFSLPNIMINLDFIYSNNQDETTSQFFTYAKGMDKTKITGNIDLMHAGELQVSINRTFVYDPLRMIKSQLKCSNSKKVLVMPMLAEPDFYTLYTEYADVDDAKEYSEHKSGDDSSEIFDIREYHNGDNMNRIHWKAVAKQDELMVKDFSYPIYKSNCILLEINKVKKQVDRGYLDGVYEMAYAIGNLACTREKQFKLAYHCNMTNSLKVFDVLNHQDLVDAIQNIVREPSYIGNRSFYDYIDSDLYENNKLFYITSTMEADLYNMLDQYRDGALSVFYIKDNQNAGEVTRLEGGLVVKVDHNDIKQGLKNVMI